MFEIDSALLLNEHAAYKARYAAYNTKLAAYNIKRTTYDTSVDNETKRKADFFKATMTPSIAIPERPCPPEQPLAMPSINFDLSKKTWASDYATQKTVATLKRSTDNLPNPAYHTRVGYYQALPDKATPSVFPYTGKVFGRLGQGGGNMPATSTPFYWAEATSSLTDGNGAYMMISIFPDAKVDTGLTGENKIIFEAKAATLDDNAAYKTIDTPVAAVSPKPGLAGASALAAGLISAAAAVASLF